jgi:hypothetical protein
MPKNSVSLIANVCASYWKTSCDRRNPFISLETEDRRLMALYLEELAAMARVGDNQSYYGTQEQIAAFNDFCDLLNLHLTGKLTAGEIDAFDVFCLKATSDEILDEGLRLVMQTECLHRDTGRGVCADCGKFL